MERRGLLFGNISTGHPRGKNLIQESLPSALPAALGILIKPEAGTPKYGQVESGVSCNRMLHHIRVHTMHIYAALPESFILRLQEAVRSVALVDSRPLLRFTDLGVC